MSAETKGNYKGLFSLKLQAFEWVGGLLAEDLNQDQPLNSVVFQWLEEPNVRLKVIPDCEAGCYRIILAQSPVMDSWYIRDIPGIMPTRSQFQALTKIAEHVHSLEERTPHTTGV